MSLRLKGRESVGEEGPGEEESSREGARIKGKIGAVTCAEQGGKMGALTCAEQGGKTPH